MAHLNRWIAAGLLLVASACSTAPEMPAATSTFVVVRHAEKATDDPSDPSLTDAGRERAAALAASLARQPVVAVYTTDYRRTRHTAQPLASARNLAVITYDAKQPADQFVSELRRNHPHGTVVIVGHSNTVPAIVSALCDCAIAEIDESDYGNLYTVRVDARGQAILSHQHD